MVYSGMGPDYRLLIRRARKMAQVTSATMEVVILPPVLQDYYLMYHETIPTAQLVYRVALVMQVRPAPPPCEIAPVTLASRSTPSQEVFAPSVCRSSSVDGTSPASPFSSRWAPAPPAAAPPVPPAPTPAAAPI